MTRQGTLAVAGVILGCASALATPPDPEKVFARAAQAGDQQAMLEAAERLRAEPSKNGVKALVRYGALVEDVDVYIAARDALAAATEGKAREELLKSCEKSKRFEMRVLCVDALALCDDDEATTAIGERLEDKEGPVRIAAIRALGRQAKRACVPLLFERLGAGDMSDVNTENEELYSALHALTGQGFETLEDWRKYWETVGDDFDPKGRGEVEAGATRVREGAGKLFETAVLSKRFVLVLDISNSMRVIDLAEGTTAPGKDGNPRPYRDPGTNWPPDPESRFMRARNEFVAFIEQLDPAVHFTIVVFGLERDTRTWNPQLQRATPRVKQDAVEFVTALRWSGATRTDLALEQAFAVADADTIYLFSDGIPERSNGSKTEPIPQDEVIAKAKTLNRARKLRLNVYGFATVSPPTKDFLRKLAVENDGEYQDIR